MPLLIVCHSSAQSCIRIAIRQTISAIITVVLPLCGCFSLAVAGRDPHKVPALLRKGLITLRTPHRHRPVLQALKPEVTQVHIVAKGQYADPPRRLRLTQSLLCRDQAILLPPVYLFLLPQGWPLLDNDPRVRGSLYIQTGRKPPCLALLYNLAQLFWLSSRSLCTASARYVRTSDDHLFILPFTAHDPCQPPGSWAR